MFYRLGKIQKNLWGVRLSVLNKMQFFLDYFDRLVKKIIVRYEALILNQTFNFTPTFAVSYQDYSLGDPTSPRDFVSRVCLGMELVEVIVKEGPGNTDVDKYNYPRDRRD